MYDLVITDGVVVNADGGTPALRDVAIEAGRVVALEPDIATGGAPTLNAHGRYVLPGIVDTHVHVSDPGTSPRGYGMMVRAGVTCALDLAGDPGQMARALPQHGCGMTVGVLVPVIPHVSVDDRDPSRHEIDLLLERSLRSGALGLKVLGGHYPVTPGAIRRVIDACASRQAYCAVHAGSTETASDVTGLEELVTLADGERVHVAHVNSYCRGRVEAPVAEAARAIHALSGATGLRSESYLTRINAADAACEDGVPVSDVVKACLQARGYAPTEAGMIGAIKDGWARIHVDDDEDGVRLANPDEGLEQFAAAAMDAQVSFAVNSPDAASALALARKPSGAFVVDALATDGGALPRNTTLAQGLHLVGAELLDLVALVDKAAATPARMLGLPDKGWLGPGSDADAAIVTSDGKCTDVVIGGRIIVADGAVVQRTTGTLLCAEGVSLSGADGLELVIVDPLRDPVWA